MKVALVFPSNLMHAPYVEYYTSILQSNNIEYDLINWNRFGISEGDIKYSFQQKSSLSAGRIRKFTDYLKFSIYAKKVIRENEYDKLIVFIPQLAIFLKSILLKDYSNNYIFDIRDYSKATWINKRLSSIIHNSAQTVISSEGYKQWLPNEYDYTISHNISKENLFADEHYIANELKSNNEVRVNNIGVIRDYKENTILIESLSQSAKIILGFIGKGVDEEKIKKYVTSNDIKNVTFYGRYDKSEELEFYVRSDLINLVRSNSTVGSVTSLANRLYNAVLMRRPLLVSKGTYMAKIVAQYNLGTAIDIYNDNIENEILDYVQNFNQKLFEIGCISFLDDVRIEYEAFEASVMSYFDK